MHRIQISLTDEQRQRIARRAQDEGKSQAAVIRRILEEALGVADGVSERLASIDATAGAVRDAPGWDTWLAAVRGRSVEDRLRALEF
jgi:hypothetical protein